jgi:hypothetical protein
LPGRESGVYDLYDYGYKCDDADEQRGESVCYQVVRPGCCCCCCCCCPLGRGGGRRWAEHFSAPAAATVPQFQKMSERFPLVSFFGVFDEEDYENSSRLTNLIDIQNIGTDLLTPTAGRCPRDMPLEHAARPPACLCLPACLPALVEPAIHMCGFPVCPPVHHGAAGCSGSVRA